MTSSIGTTGTGGVFIGGTESGLNTTALIDAAVAQKTFRADRLQVEIDENLSKMSAYDELMALTSNIDSALQKLRGKESQFDTTERVWDLKSGTVATSDGSDFSAIADIAIESNAVAGSYQFEVTQLAEVQRVAGASYADATAALGFAGTFDLSLSGGGGTATISISAGQSLNDIAAAINAQRDTTNVSASVLKVGENAFQLIIEGTETNQTIQVTGVTGDDVLNLSGVTDGFGGFNDQLQAAQGSIVEFDGVTISRDDNNYDDLLAGVDIDIKNAAPGVTIDLTVGNDTVTAKQAILDFVDAYNAFRDFVVKNQQIDSSGNVPEAAVLFSDNLLNGLEDQYGDILALNFGNGGNIQTIRDLGLTIGNNNKLQVSDEARLDNALLNNFDEVQAAFASGAQDDNAEFALISNSSTLSSTSIIFDLTTDGAGTITGVSANGDGAAFTISGNTVTGAAGTIYEGLTFAYVGSDTNVTVNVDLTQGLADRLVNGTSGYTDGVSGLVIQEKAALQSQNQDKTQEANEILANAERFRETQIAKYSKLESDLAALNVLLDQIRAILGNNDDD